MRPGNFPRADQEWIRAWTEPPASYSEAFAEARERMGGRLERRDYLLPDFLEAVASGFSAFGERSLADFLERFGNRSTPQGSVAEGLAKNPALDAVLRAQLERWCLREKECLSEEAGAVAVLETLRRRAPRGRGRRRLSPEAVEYLIGRCLSSRGGWDETASQAFALLLRLPEVEEGDWLRVMNFWPEMNARLDWSAEIRRLHRARGLTLEMVRRLARLGGRQMQRELWGELIQVPGAWRDEEVRRCFEREAPMDAFVSLFDFLPEEERGELWRERVRAGQLFESVHYLRRRPERLEALLGGEEESWRALVRRASSDELHILCRAARGARFGGVPEALRSLPGARRPVAPGGAAGAGTGASALLARPSSPLPRGGNAAGGHSGLCPLPAGAAGPERRDQGGSSPHRVG